MLSLLKHLTLFKTVQTYFGLIRMYVYMIVEQISMTLGTALF